MKKTFLGSLILLCVLFSASAQSYKFDFTGNKKIKEGYIKISPTFEILVKYNNAKAVTPGQAAVFYDGEVVLGGGTGQSILLSGLMSFSISP